MKILIADDDAVTRLMLEKAIGKMGFEVVSAADGAQAWEIITSGKPPEIVVVDWLMPGMEGVEICRRLRSLESGTRKYTFAILLTAKSDKKDIIAGMEAGADDYISKPFDPQELEVRIRAGRRIVELQDQLRSANEKLLQLSRTDSLTGLLNRRAFYEVMDGEIARSERQNMPLSIVMLDLDHFKRINDSMGHLAGDAVLKEFSGRISTAVRHYDVLCRYGGEEFLVLLPGSEIASAVKTAERFREIIAGTPFEAINRKINVTSSLGVAQHREGENADVLVDRADSALYKAKQKGRNRVEIYSS